MNKFSISRLIQAAALLVGMLILILVTNTQAAKLYKWIDSEGVMHYSDKMPPESTKGAHAELDERGISRREIDRAKTDEERLSETMEKSLDEQQRKIRAEKQARQRMLDQILLQTFTTERDLIITRDDRLNSVDSIINLTIANNKRLVPRIEETNEKIARIQNSGRDVPENLTKSLENLNGQYEKNKDFINLKQQERKELSEQFESDMRRFRVLKGIEPESESESEQTTEDDEKIEPQVDSDKALASKKTDEKSE